MEELSRNELIHKLLEAEARADAAEKRASEEKAEAEARADAAEKRASEEKAEAEARADAAEKRASKEKALREGEYYGRITKVISFQVELIPENSLDQVRRSSRCDRFYRTAIAAAEAHEKSLMPALRSSPTSCYDEAVEPQAKKRRISVENNGLDGTAQEAAEIAHLVPHSAQCGSFYGELLEAMVGVNFNEPREKRLQVLIHGQVGTDANKEKKTGIKHCVMNLIRVMHQKKFMDGHPSQVLLLPILGLEDVLNFGESDEYFIAVLCSNPAVYKQMLLTGDYDTCGGNELSLAVNTLRAFTFAVAQHAHENIADDDLKSISTERTILIPARELLRDSKVAAPIYQPPEELPVVLKLKLSNDGNNATTCDPWLLCLKSAVMFSSFLGRKLLPGCQQHFSGSALTESSYYESSGMEFLGFGDKACVPDEISAPIWDVASDVTTDSIECVTPKHGRPGQSHF